MHLYSYNLLSTYRYSQYFLVQVLYHYCLYVNHTCFSYNGQTYLWYDLHVYIWKTMLINTLWGATHTICMCIFEKWGCSIHYGEIHIQSACVYLKTQTVQPTMGSYTYDLHVYIWKTRLFNPLWGELDVWLACVYLNDQDAQPTMGSYMYNLHVHI